MFELLNKGPDQWRESISLAITTGLRKGELLALKWSDIDFERATLQGNEGDHAKNISARLGHADIKTTLNIYSHYMQEADERVADKLDALFSPDRKNNKKKA